METVKKIRVARGWGGTNKQNAEDFQGSETMLYDTIIMDTCHYAFVKPTECTTPRVNSYVKGGLWAIMMCPRRFTDYNKCNTLVQDMSGITSGVVNIIWELYVLFNFAVSLKLL